MDAPTLVADIGGTTARMALARAGAVLADTIATWPCAEHPDAEALLGAYLAGRPRPRAACLALAGPVRDGACDMTNRGWRVEAARLARGLGLEAVTLLNDLQAQAHALDHLTAQEMPRLRPGRGRPGEARLVIGLGTGVNLAARLPCCTVPPAEAGQAALPAFDDETLALRHYLHREGTAGRIEDALSGAGLARLFAFHGGQPVAPRDVPERLRAGDPAARAAVDLYARIAGRVAQGWALAFLATGGVALAGSVARALAPELGEGLRAAFATAPLLADTPVHLVAADTAALAGCAALTAGRA